MQLCYCAQTLKNMQIKWTHWKTGSTMLAGVFQEIWPVFGFLDADVSTSDSSFSLSSSSSSSSFLLFLIFFFSSSSSSTPPHPLLQLFFLNIILYWLFKNFTSCTPILFISQSIHICFSILLYAPQLINSKTTKKKKNPLHSSIFPIPLHSS